MTTTLYMADWYSDLGISSIPTKPPPKSKEPALPRWKEFQDRRSTADKRRKWFRGGRRGIANVCGRISKNLGVRDWDQMPTYEAWKSRHPDAAAMLPTVASARGMHGYFRTVDPIKTQCLDDGEIRGDGSYVVAPPSLHPEGITYTWIHAPHDDIPIVDPIAIGLVGVTQEVWGDSCVTTSSSTLPPPPPKNSRRSSSISSVLDGCLRGHGLNDVRLAVEAKLDSPEQLVNDLVSRAVRHSQPTGSGQRHRRIFELVQALKAIPAISEGDPPYDVFCRWFRLAEPKISTKDFQTSWKDFDYGWRHCRFPGGANPLAD